MEKKKTILIKILFVFFVMSCDTRNTNPEAADIVFKNANIITMSSNQVLENNSVYISNGIIKDIGKFEDLNLPDETAIIDAKGKFLTPGFSDMHSHIWNKEELSLFLANGVTTIRNMWGEPWHLTTREQIRKGKLLGPDIFTSGPLTDGVGAYWEGSYILTDPDKVEEYMAYIIEEGYDFIKVYDKLSPMVFSKVIKEAKKHGIPVVGHVPWRVGIKDYIKSNATSIEHFIGYKLDQYEVSDLSEVIDFTVKSGVWNCPTLKVIKQLAELSERSSNPEKFLQSSIPELKYVNPEVLVWWRSAYGADYNLEESKKLLKVLYSKGANIVSGTDHGNPYIVTGFSLHDEFELMNQAGLSPYDVLLTTTVNPAKMLGIEDRVGTIEIGKEADLVLLKKNPLEDIKNTRSISGVMVKGKWLDQNKLKKMLKEVEVSYSSE